MKICYVLNSGDPGGVEQHVLDLTRGMVERGHEVYVVSPWGKMINKYFDAGARIRVDRPRLDIDPFYIFRLARFINKIQPNILHVHMLKTVVNGLIAVKVFRLLGFARNQSPNSSKPGLPKHNPGLSPSGFPVVIVHIHTPLPEWQIPWWKKKLDIFVNRIVTNWAADMVVALTESRRRVKIEGEGIDPEKIRIISNGVDLEKVKSERLNVKKDYRQRLGFSEDTVLVGTLSRLTVEKGIDYLIEAVSQLSAYSVPHTAYQILVGGSGKLKEDLEEKAASLKVEGRPIPQPPGIGQAKPRRFSLGRRSSSPVREPRIQFLGFIPEEEKWAYLNALDIFVFPSLAEGFGISLIEAMACGCACLASNLEVLEEVGGDAVEFFETKNPEDLARKLADLIRDKEKRKQLAVRAQERVEQEYSLENFWDRYENLYCTLL